MIKPKVSVLMTVYNAEPFLREAVDSVLSQSFKDFEYIIVDDKSKDKSLEILRSYHDPRIVLIENTVNQGQTASLVTGMNRAKGEYMVRLDADDVCLPHRLRTQVKFLEANLEISVVGSAAIFFNHFGFEFVGHQPTEHDLIKCELLYGFTMLHPSVMLRNADFDSHGLNYDPNFRCSQDHDLWTRSIRLLRFANIHEPLLKIRNHDEQMGQTRKLRMHEESNAIRQRQLDELGVCYTPEELLAFNMGADGSFPEPSIGQLAAYDRMVAKIVEANKMKGVFHELTLARMGAAKLRGLCRAALLAGNSAGRYYWRSSLRSSDKILPRELIGMTFRSIFARRIVGG